MHVCTVKMKNNVLGVLKELSEDDFWRRWTARRFLRYFTVPAHERKQGKLGQARALKGFFVGYSYAKYHQPCYRVVAKYANGIYGRLRITKDVTFDLTINFKSDLEKDLPTLKEFNSIPSLELVHDQDNADALRRQLIMSPAIQEVTVPPTTDAPVSVT